MSDLSRRRFLFPGSRKAEDGFAREPEDARAPHEPVESALPRPSADGLAWQRQQGQEPPGDAQLPSVISWLTDYLEEPPLPKHARTAPLLRPPGAIEESEFLRRCTSCGDCATACPHGAIAKAPPIFKDAAGTPIIDPGRAPCWLCEDLPCITACETSALVADGAPMGTAHVMRFDCLNSMGNLCSTCVEQCPVPGAIVVRGQAPVVDLTLCAGCGVCHYVCPAPSKAVAIIPNSNRSIGGRKPGDAQA